MTHNKHYDFSLLLTLISQLVEHRCTHSEHQPNLIGQTALSVYSTVLKALDKQSWRKSMLRRHFTANRLYIYGRSVPASAPIPTQKKKTAESDEELVWRLDATPTEKQIEESAMLRKCGSLGISSSSENIHWPSSLGVLIPHAVVV